MEIKNFVIGIVKEIHKNWIGFYIDEKTSGFLYIKNISEYYIQNTNKIFKLNDKLTCEVIFKKGDVYYLDFKATRALFLRKPFEFEMKETKNGSKKLFKKNSDEVEKWVN